MRKAALYAKAMLTHLLPDWLYAPLARRHYVTVVRSFSSPEASLLARLVDRGDHVVDLGANVGWYTRILAEAAGPAGRVSSLEPIPRTYRFLENSVQTLGLGNVTLFNYAASNHNGTALMEVPRESGLENFYQASLVSTPTADRNLRRFHVRLRTLDTLLAHITQPLTVIKCDVEGHESEALAGARGLITRFHPAIFVEVSGDPDDASSATGALVRWLEKEGYAAYWLRGAVLVGRARGQHSVDYFFLTAAHLSRLVRRGTPVERPKPEATGQVEGTP